MSLQLVTPYMGQNEPIALRALTDVILNDIKVALVVIDFHDETCAQAVGQGRVENAGNKVVRKDN